MARQIILPVIPEEDALGFIIAWLKSPQQYNNSTGLLTDGTFYLPDVITAYLQRLMADEQRRNPPQGMTSYELDHVKNSSPFYDAAWQLCRRSILRPGISFSRQIQTGGEIVGARFAVTPYGKIWLNQTNSYDTIPFEHDRFTQLLLGHVPRFGQGYRSRAQEAMSCYRAHSYFACCVMCGAAAESILLALAIAKKGNEEEVLREYRASNGRSKVEKMLIGQQSQQIQQDFATYTSLLKYWRDEAAHGTLSDIDDEEAFTSLILLLSFARFADSRWNTLTQ